MSLKLFKPQESCLANPELKNHSSIGDLPQTQQRRWRNTWGFCLEKKIPLDVVFSSRIKEAQIRKKMVRKYYGKKIPYIMKPREMKTIISRSKLLKYVRVDNIPKIKESLKIKGNLVVLANNLDQKRSKSDALQENDRILFKKIIKNCEKAEVLIVDWRDLWLPKYLLAVKHLEITISRRFELDVVGEILCNLLDLESVKVQTEHYNANNRRAKKSKIGFFASLHKLSHLKRVKLITDSGVIEKAGLKQDLEEFYEKPRDFNLSITINADDAFGKEFKPGLVRILNAAEYLSLSDCKYNRAPYDEDYVKMTKEAKRKMKRGTKNCVKIFTESCVCRIDVLRILSYCDSLEHLHIREGDDRINWKPSSDQEEIKGLRNLKTVALECSSFILENSQENTANEEVDQKKEKDGPFRSPLFTILPQLKEKCPSLQHLSLYLSTSEFLNLEWVQEVRPTDVQFFLKTVNRLGQEISAFDKLKAFGLLMVPNDFRRFPFGEILSSSHLESFQVKFSAETKGSHPDW